MTELSEKLYNSLYRIWNWSGNNKPTDFRSQDGKEWLLLNTVSMAQKLAETPDAILCALKELKAQGKIDALQQQDKIIFSLTPAREPASAPAVQAYADTTSEAMDYSLLPLETRYALWNININKEWSVMSDIAKNHPRFNNNIQKYFGYRRFYPVSPVILDRIKSKIDRGEISDVYAYGLTLTQEDSQKAWAKYNSGTSPFALKVEPAEPF